MGFVVRVIVKTCDLSSVLVIVAVTECAKNKYVGIKFGNDPGDRRSLSFGEMMVLAIVFRVSLF